MPSSGIVNVTRVFIVGAGYSHYAGLPLQSEFTQSLLAARNFGKGPSKDVVSFLSEFVDTSFGHSADSGLWPDLEDLFTCVDLAANTGHHLGSDYSPAELRTVRRALISRIIRTLGQRYTQQRAAPDDRWRQLDKFMKAVHPSRDAFISLNWDTIVEDRMLALHPGTHILYGNHRNEITKAAFPSQGHRVKRVRAAITSTVRITKMHGSINWLYCDNCRRVFWFPPNDWAQIADQMTTPRDWEIIQNERTEPVARWKCCDCKDVLLSTRIATLSFRKALEFSMFQRSWAHAERLLRAATDWVFIGYSLPAADFEFKHLLKRVELSHTKLVKVHLVTGGDGAEQTHTNFKRFFGRALASKYFPDGLTDEAIAHFSRPILPRRMSSLPSLAR